MIMANDRRCEIWLDIVTRKLTRKVKNIKPDSDATVVTSRHVSLPGLKSPRPSVETVYPAK